jgi:hypothetical protein
MHPGLYQLMYQQPGDIQWTDADLEQTSRGGAETQEVIRRAIEAGQIGPIADLEMFQMAVFVALHGATSLAISRRLAPGALGMSAPALVEAASGIAEYVLAAVLAQYPPTDPR